MCVIWDATTFCCVITTTYIFIKAFCPFYGKRHLNKMKVVAWEMMKHSFKERDNFDVDVTNSTEMLVFNLVFMNIWGYVKFIIHLDGRYVWSHKHEYSINCIVIIFMSGQKHFCDYPKIPKRLEHQITIT